MIGETLSLRLEKPKFSKCFVSNQILGEGYLWLVWERYGIISLGNTPQIYLFMTQGDFMLFLRLWVRSIQALCNPIRCFPNDGILFLISPNLYRKYNKRIFNPRNHFFSLIFNPPIDSSPWISRKNNEFHKKTFSNLVFGDEFDPTMPIGMCHDLFHVL